MDLEHLCSPAETSTPEITRYFPFQNLLNCYRIIGGFYAFKVCFLFVTNLLQEDLEDGNGTFVWTDGYKYSGGWSKVQLQIVYLEEV